MFVFYVSYFLKLISQNLGFSGFGFEGVHCIIIMFLLWTRSYQVSCTYLKEHCLTSSKTRLIYNLLFILRNSGAYINCFQRILIVGLHRQKFAASIIYLLIIQLEKISTECIYFLWGKDTQSSKTLNFQLNVLWKANCVWCIKIKHYLH